MVDIKQSVQSQFGRVAENYRTSQVHAVGADLQRLIDLVSAQTVLHALDAGCGAGHAAVGIAPHVGDVVAFDLTPTMLEQVTQLAADRGLNNVTTRQGDVEALPFADATFDLVVSRYSAHHWPHPKVAISEIARVLKAGGQFILSDIVAPDDPAQDTFLQALELLRDPSHVRDHCVAQWQAIFNSAGLHAEIDYEWMLELNFIAWVERIQTPPLNIDMLKSLFDGAASEIQTAFAIQETYDFSIPGALLIGHKV